jgi:hypothetical protein
VNPVSESVEWEIGKIAPIGSRAEQRNATLALKSMVRRELSRHGRPLRPRHYLLLPAFPGLGLRQNYF